MINITFFRIFVQEVVVFGDLGRNRTFIVRTGILYSIH